MNRALGLIEVLGLTAAMTALDAAIKAADVTFLLSVSPKRNPPKRRIFF